MWHKSSMLQLPPQVLECPLLSSLTGTPHPGPRAYVILAPQGQPRSEGILTPDPSAGIGITTPGIRHPK